MSQQRKQKALEKQKRKRREKQRYRSMQAPPAAMFVASPPGVKVVPTPRGTEKMSEVLDEFVDPYMDPNGSLEEMRKLYTMGVAAWNAALFSGAKREELLEDLARTLPPEARRDFRMVIEPMIQRKLRYFAANQRCIFDFNLEDRPSGPYLQVMATLPE